MISISEVLVQSFSLEFLDIRWEIADTRENPSDYSFTVQRSESPEGPFEPVSQPLVGAFVFRDKTVDMIARWRTYYYQIVIRKLVGGETANSHVECLRVQPDRAALYMIREQQLLNKVHIGTPVLIYKRRSQGPQCPSCYDPVRGRTTDSSCTVCFSSKYRGGYLAPIPTFVNVSPGNRTKQPQALVTLEPDERMFDMSGYPPLSVGDMIVEPTNRRWRVTSIQERTKQGFVIRQLVRVTRVPQLDIFQKFPIDATKFPSRDDKELWPTTADLGPMKMTPEEPAGR